MFKNNTLLIWVLIICTIPTAWATHWNVFMYMDASDDLNDMAIKSFTDMLRAKIQDSSDIHIQLHAYDAAGLYYTVSQDRLVYCGETVLTGNAKFDFIEAARRAFAHNDAEHTMLILWNHGWGILDPQWNADTKEWEVGSDGLSNICPIKRSRSAAYREHKHRHKGFMFSKEPRSYLSNTDLIESLHYIQNELLGGKKFDILAFDTCMGGMLEIAYEVAPYADFLIGNQTCSLRDGFDYYGIFKALNAKPHPRLLAEQMVNIFDAYYQQHDDSGIYGHTALDLSFISDVTRTLDDLLFQLLNIKNIEELLVKAHIESPRFCLFPMYTDCVSFMKLVQELIELKNLKTDETDAAFAAFYRSVEDFVLARCSGFTNKDSAHGFAIYLPSYAIDQSYIQTNFAHNTLWLNCLKAIEIAAGDHNDLE